eukprot:2949707-Amphidinium_carterae.2
MQQHSYNGLPAIKSLYEVGSVNNSGLLSHLVGTVVQDADKTINLNHQNICGTSGQSSLTLVQQSAYAQQHSASTLR